MINTIIFPIKNSKILVVTSLILIFAMMYLIVLPALAGHCGLLKLLLDLAIDAANAAMDVVRWLMDIGAPQWMIDAANDVVNYLWDRAMELSADHDACLEEHESGGCDS